MLSSFVLVVVVTLLADVVNGQASIILPQLSPFVGQQEEEADGVVEQLGSLIIPECELMLSTMKDKCLVNTIPELTQLSQKRIVNCCELGDEFVKLDCYDPCDETQLTLLPLWNAMCAYNLTEECTTSADTQQTSLTLASPTTVQVQEFRAASITEPAISELQEVSQPQVSILPPTTSNLSTLILGEPAQKEEESVKEDFVEQLNDAVQSLTSSLGSVITSTVVLDSSNDEDISPILQELSDIPKVSISQELFSEFPEIANELSSGKLLTLLLPTDDAWLYFQSQREQTLDELKTDRSDELQSVVSNHIGWGQQQFGGMDRLEDVQLLTLAENTLTASRSALSGSIVVRGCCDVENTAKVVEVDRIVDPQFAVHFVDRVILSESAFEAFQGSSGISPSFNFSVISSPLAIVDSQVQTDDVTSLPDDDDDSNAPMSLQELRELVNVAINLPSYSAVQESVAVTFVPTTTSPTTQNYNTPGVTSDSLPIGTVMLGQTLERDTQLQQTPVIEDVPPVSSTAAQSVLQKLPAQNSTNAFDTAPIGQPTVKAQQEEQQETSGLSEELPADILEIQAFYLDTKCNNVSEVLAEAPELANFKVILEQTDLMRVLDDLSTELDFTLFAPNNEGVESLILERGRESIEQQLANTTTMELILSYHVVPEKVVFAGYKSGDQLQTTLKQGDEPLALTLQNIGTNTAIRGVGKSANVVDNLLACGVTIYVIDAILLPFE